MSRRQRRTRGKRLRHDRGNGGGRRGSLAAGAALAAGATFGAGPAAADAADFIVTKVQDTDGACVPGDCSLREAINAADSGVGDDRILFQAGVTGTINLGSRLPNIDQPLQILGPGATQLTVSGGNTVQILYVNTAPGDDVTLSGLTLSDGSVMGVGAAIHKRDADLTIREAVIRDSSTTGIGNYGGGIYSLFGSTTVERSTISGNSTAGDFANGGGLASREEALTVDRSTVSGNHTYGQGADGGGISAIDPGSVTIERSTVSGNETAGVAAHGAGVWVEYRDQTTIASSTISGNSATGAATHGGGIDVYTTTADPILTNTIVAGNSAPGGPDLYSATETFDASFTLVGDGSGATINETIMDSNVLDQDPLLGPLQENGGPTETMALPPTSQAVNKGRSFGATSDQRGLTRPVAYPGVPFSTAAGADGADIGAFELQAPAPPPPPPPPPPVSNNFTFGKLKLNRRRGIAFLFVRVPGAGRVVLRGPKVRRVVRNPKGATRVRLPIRARPKVRRRLLRTGRIRTRVRVTYRPTGGAARTKFRRVRLIKKRR
jgi:CSLREA domain-containing protein